MTKVSVCIPTYNCEKYIAKTIASVFAQTYQDFEVIIVDDCSKDKTYELLKNLSSEKIKLFKNEENLGLVGNWNECLKHATGEYIHFLMCDDLLSPNSLDEKVKILDE